MRKTNNPNINTREYWDKTYGTVQKRRDYADAGTDRVVERAPETYRFTRTLEEINPTDKFLDIGCGVGVMTQLAKNTYPDSEVWGTDISAKAIEDNKAENPSIKYIYQHIGKQDQLPDDYFDVVFAGEVLEHLDNPSLLLKDAYRVLKKGGKCIITTPLDNAIESKEHTWFFTQQDVEELYLNNGFNNIRFVYLPNGEHIMIIYAVGIKS